MDYFQNGSPKNYQLPGIGFYMGQESGPNEAQQMHQTVLPPPQLGYEGNYFTNGAEFCVLQQPQQPQVQPVLPMPVAVQQPKIGQKRKGAYQKNNRSNNARREYEEGIDGKKVDPFAPECSIPLPYQLGDDYSYYGQTAVWKRNERERHRVRCVNDGYEKLRNHIPVPSDKRLSKVETLRFAIRYIQHLEKLLADSGHDEHCDCDFTVRSSSVSDSCQSPAISTTEQQTGRRKYRRRGARGGGGGSGDEGSDDNA